MFYVIKVKSALTGRFLPRDKGKYIGPFGLVSNKNDAKVVGDIEKKDILNSKYGFDLMAIKVPRPKSIVRDNPSVPKKGVWTKVKAVKFNKDGSVSLMK